MAQTALPPLTHHQILALVAPFSRSGRHVDLAASDRMARRVAFKAVAHGAITETLLLDNPSEGRFKLTRVLTVQGGLQARLTAEGSEPAALLARVDASGSKTLFGQAFQQLHCHRHEEENKYGDHDRDPLRLLVKWRDRYQVISKGTDQVRLEISDFEAAQREIKHLQRRLAEVEEEREILKKTINIFSRKSQ